MSKYPRRSILVVLAVLCASSLAQAAQSAEQFIRDKQTALAQVLKQAEGAAKQKKIEALFDSMLNYPRLAEDSLGKYWAERSDDEKKEFTETLTKLVRRAYRRNLDKTADYKIEYKGEVDGETGTVVRTVASSKTNSRQEPVSIDYVLAQAGGGWKVHDIVTEGSSLVKNYRRQFGRVLKKDGFAELIRLMKRKLEEDS